MDFQAGYSAGDYAKCINSLASLANRFLEASRQFNLRFVAAPEVPRLTRAIQFVQTAELPQVKTLEPGLTELNRELDTLVKKFQLVQRSHQFDSSLKNFLGDFSKDSEDAFKKLSNFTEDTMRLADSVITTYAQIERDKKPAKAWIATILGPEATTTKSAIAKAKEAQKVIADVESVCRDVRNMCQQVRNELDAIKKVAIRNLIKRAPYSYSEV